MGLCPGGYKYRDISRGEVRHDFFCWKNRRLVLQKKLRKNQKLVFHSTFLKNLKKVVVIFLLRALYM